VTFGVKTHSDPSYIFSGVRSPQTPMMHAPASDYRNYGTLMRDKSRSLYAAYYAPAPLAGALSDDAV